MHYNVGGHAPDFSPILPPMASRRGRLSVGQLGRFHPQITRNSHVCQAGDWTEPFDSAVGLGASSTKGRERTQGDGEWVWGDVAYLLFHVSFFFFCRFFICSLARSPRTFFLCRTWGHATPGSERISQCLHKSHPYPQGISATGMRLTPISGASGYFTHNPAHRAVNERTAVTIGGGSGRPPDMFLCNTSVTVEGWDWWSVTTFWRSHDPVNNRIARPRSIKGGVRRGT